MSDNKYRVTSTTSRHGIAAVDAAAAAERYVAACQVSEPGVEPYRELRAGWGTRGRLLEVVILTTSAGEDVVIHAMVCRQAIRRRLGL